MKTSSRMLAAFVGTSLVVAAAPVWAAPPTAACPTWLGLAVAGQASPQARSPVEARRQVLELLAKARQAMKDGNYETADSLLGRAEGIPVTFGVMHMGDTPKKARRDLTKLRGGRAPQKPSDLFAPEGSEKPANKTGPAVRDPFAQQQGFEPTMGRPPADTGMPVDGSVMDAPPEEDTLGKLPGERGFPTESPFGKGNTLAPPGDDSQEPGLPAGGNRPVRQSSDAMLREESGKLLYGARRALAVGDVRRAGDLLSQAKALGLEYDFHDDSPAKVEAVIEHYAQLLKQGGSPDSETFRRRKAESLLEQAEGLLAWQDLEEAKRLAESAQRLNVVYGPADVRPDMLLERIVAAGRVGGVVEHLPPVDQTAAQRGPAAAEQMPPQKEQVRQLLSRAKAALAAGDLDRAKEIAEQAESVGLPDAAFGRNDERPWQLLLKIQRLQQEQRQVRPAGGAAPIATDANEQPTANRAIYDREHDPTRNVPATAQETIEPAGTGVEMFQRGEQALRDHDRTTALGWFRKANLHRDELDPVMQQHLQDRLQLLGRPLEPAGRPAGDGALTANTAANEKLKLRQVMAELERKEKSSSKVRETNPKQARQDLEDCRELVQKSDLDTKGKEILLRRIDRQLHDLEHFVESNRGKIELNERNEQVRAKIDRERQTKVEVQQKLADLVEQYNTLMHEHRYAEAEVIYKRAAEIAPDELIVQQLKNQLTMVSRSEKYKQIRDAKEEYFVTSLNGVENSAHGNGVDDEHPMIFRDVKEWARLTKSRKELLSEINNRKTDREVEIEKKLRTPVWLKYQEAPLSQVIEDLGKLAQVPTHLDPRGLIEEGVDSHTPVTINLTSEISLKSALNLILEPLHLSYVVKNEVLQITSEQMRDGEVVTRTYNVADLVMPIPNFVPNPNMGLQGALHQAQLNLPNNWSGLNSDGPMPVAATANGAGATAVVDSRSMLAQMSADASAAIPSSSGGLPGLGPGGLNGGNLGDYETLIELITSTIAPTTWDDVGGPGSIQQFPANLSLVISQTQEVHEEIADLLEQLRRLQDLQVTIEVRFITLNDNFFERIGVNFDFSIPTRLNKPFTLFGEQLAEAPLPNTGATTAFPPPSNSLQDVALPANGLTKQEAVTVGLAPGSTGSVLYSSNLDIPFQQGSFGLATPQFGGYQAGAGATLGFAILSNIEAYFLMEASQGDRRSNVLQAPKVTLFNGQQAMVVDVTQTPFVVSVIPVVGAFAAAQQPVILVLNEGTALTVQAVISSDRRFVRLTLVPLFSNITAVNTFTFTGSTSTTQNSDSEGPSDNPTKRVTSSTTSNQGTTVQLPSFSIFTVMTTVSVPDGGTVLLGGVKRLSEGRNEFGVPVLSKIPYVNRLFKNVGIGRETQSLMMMVTPRIIIQEEEEALLGIPSTP